MRYAKNAGAVFSLKYHLVWCPKYRRKILINGIAKRLEEILQQKTKELEIKIHAIKIMPEHVHLFIEAEPILCIAEIVNRLKGVSSRILRQEFPAIRSKLPTLWSRSYYACTVGHISEQTVRHYIENQKGK